MKTVERRIVVVGHRGASGYEPENTFASFDLAVEQGADMLELDVHLTKDGVPVVIHDDTLQRTTGATGKVREKSLAQIRTLNAATNNPNHPFEPVPTLEEVVEKYHNDVGLMVEIKYGSSFYKNIEEKVVSILEKSNAIGNCEIISFDFDCVRKVKSIRRDIPTGIIFIGRIPDFTPLAEEIGCSALHPSYEYVSMEDVLQTRKTANLHVYTWTIDDPEDIRYQCEVIKPDGIVTDYPDVALREARRL
ncbi:MAG TPA: glycerophosphodiester phosphodiesterase family protein [archaeon]|nr:glycerophosphodiester phosphodiesterase family protein [archaeon]